VTVASKVVRSKKPPGKIILPPSAFADDWADKPAGDVAIGLRFVSQADADVGRREAEREAVGFYSEMRGTHVPTDPETVADIYNDALIMHAVARGTCNPNDVTEPYWVAADDQVKHALTPAGARRIWDELVIMTKSKGPSRRAADPDECKKLGRLLAAGVQLDDECRKLCAHLLERMPEDLVELPDDEDDVEIAEEAPAYFSKAV
jgi:hypothetical protein